MVFLSFFRAFWSVGGYQVTSRLNRNHSHRVYGGLCLGSSLSLRSKIYLWVSKNKGRQLTSCSSASQSNLKIPPLCCS